MNISIADLEFLTSVRGEHLLAELASEDLSAAATLSLVTRLRKTYTAQEVNKAVTMARLRQKATTKFGDDAARMFFTETALQQASDPLVRTYRANRIARQAGSSLLDAACGIGSDSLAFARTGFHITGIDTDPVRIAIAQHNAKTLEISNSRFEVADIRFYPAKADVIFFDPARRDDSGRRLFDVEQYIPPLSVIRRFEARETVVKLSPGVNLDQLQAYAGYVEFISVNGDLKEAVLWLGKAAAVGAQATLITSTHDAAEVLHWHREGVEPDARLSEPRTWLLEPDPALIRAGLVRDAAYSIDGYLFDETIAFITSDARPGSPWFRGWRVVDWMPFHLKKLRAYLRERNIGVLTVKKRGSPITPEQLTAQLKLKGENAATVVLTRLSGEPIVIICEDYMV